MASEGGLGGPEGGPGDGIAWNGGERGLSSFEGAFFLRGGFLPSRGAFFLRGGLSSFEGGFPFSRGAFFLRGGLSSFERGFLLLFFARGASFLPFFFLLSSFFLFFLFCLASSAASFLKGAGEGAGERELCFIFFCDYEKRTDTTSDCI